MKLIFLLFAFALSFKALGSSPYFVWKVLETEHFEILYNESQKELALKYAFSAEESYRILEKIFSDLPSKTVVVIDDSTDLTNGSATFIPYDWITIFPALPNPGESLDQYGFWPTSIMIHELTHIANFQPASGFYTPLVYLMGRIVAPNAFLPRWYLEGLAVDSESRYTSFGRLRSSRTQGILRSLSQDKSFHRFGIDQINEVSTPTWPFGERPYYFGSLLQKSLVDRGSPDLREKWNQRYGRRVPFLIEEVPRDEFHESYAELLNDAYTELYEKALKQIEDIKMDGEFKTVSYLPVDHEQFEPRMSPDGNKLAYISRSYRRSGLWLLERASNLDSFSSSKPKHLINVASPLRLEWSKDSKGFYFDEVDMDTPFVAYRRVYYYDLERGKKKLITPDLRAQEPSLNFDQTHMAFIGTKSEGQRTLGLFSLEDGSHRVLYEASLLERLSSPLFVDKEKILFVKKDLEGKDALMEFNLSTNSVSKKNLGFKDIRFPRPHNGRILFISADSGVDNVYLTSEDFTSARAVTNTSTWIHSFSSASAVKESYPLVFSQMTSKGLRLFETESKSFQLRAKEPLIQYEERPDENLPQENSIAYEERSFYPFKYLLPRYWIPFIYPLDGGVIIQGSTAGTDPVGVNQYLLSGSYDTLTQGSSYGLSYQNNSFPVSIGAFAAKYQEYLGASDATFEKTNLGGQLLGPIPALSQRWTVGTGYSKSTSKLGRSRDQREGPEAFINYTSLLDRRYSEFGKLFSLSFQKFLSGPDRVNYDRLAFSLGKKHTMPFKGDHSLWLGLKGSFANDLPIADLLNFGDRSLGANYLVNLTESQYLYRGYPSGSLVGRQLLNSNLEYRFPVSDMYFGNGTTPVFFRTLSGVLFVDAMAVDGAYYDLKASDPSYRRTEISEVHFSTGGELRLDTTLGYHLPLTFILGGYYGLSRQMGENFSLFIGIGGQDPLSETTYRTKGLEFAR